MYPRLFELPWSAGPFGPITVYTYGVLLAAASALAEPPSKAPPSRGEATPRGATPEADAGASKDKKPGKDSAAESAAKDAIKKLSESQPTTAVCSRRLGFDR